MMTRLIDPLNAIKAVHTLAWAFFAGCIIAIPFAALAGRLDYALILIGIVMIEVVIIVVNDWRCPLTPIAARYTTDRSDNFDIFLPLWLARHNKSIFGTLFGGGVLFTLVHWLGWAG
jgi:hypothetical protein